jgi:alpha-beta hydrolase superfamily lysophospholipase
MRPKLVAVAILGLILSIALIFMKDTSGGLNPEDKKRFSSAPGTADSTGTVVDEFIKNHSEDNSIRWFYSNKRGDLNGVALVIHGLNLRPDKMLPIVDGLTASGIDVLGLSLRGHGANYTHREGTDGNTARLQAFKAITYQLWMNEAYLAYLHVKEEAEKKNVPLFLTAFSLGGLIGLDLFASEPDVHFEKMVLFAPAISLHAILYLERLLSPFPRLVIPSLGPKSYLANEQGTPIAGYNALFDGLEHFEKHLSPKINVPTLVLIDEEDELVSPHGLKKFVRDNNLDQWKFYLIQKGKSTDRETFYHHIIDEPSTGKEVWQEIMTTAAKHLGFTK